jgi:hypothetical protein
VYALMVTKIFQKLCPTLYNYYLLFASLKLLPNFEKMHTETLLRIPFSVIGRCSLVPTTNWLQGKCGRINLSQAASGMILQNHERLPKSIFSFKAQNCRFRAFEAG